MRITEITAQKLEEELGFSEVPDAYVILAKHSVMGMESGVIAEILGCTTEDIKEAESDPIYKAVRAFIAGRYANQMANQSAGWDDAEDIALQNLLKRLPFEKDGDFLLRVAAVANKAQRRARAPERVLDPSQHNGSTVITLTQRLVSRIQNNGDKQVEQTRQLSIRDGSMSNPSFEEVDGLLSIRGPQALPKSMPRTRVEPTVDELVAAALGES